MTTMTRKPRQDIQDNSRTAGPSQSGQVGLTNQSRQASLDRTERTGQDDLNMAGWTDLL
jgi:hypothetical protein